MPFSSWSPWSYDFYDPSSVAYELANWFLPYMTPYHQGQTARWLQGNIGELPVSVQSQVAAYPQVSAPPSTTAQWLAGLSNLAGAPTPAYPGSAEQNWLAGLVSSVLPNLGPGATRAQQRHAALDISQALEQAPSSALAQLGQSLLQPVLQAPAFGQAAPLGSYMMPYRTKGGLVANPWFV